MKSWKDNRIVVDLRKCQAARFYYRNQWGDVRNVLPQGNTYNNQKIADGTMALYHPDYPNETLTSRIHRRGGGPDIWVPEAWFKLSANHCLTYTGDKAISIYGKWCEQVFNKRK